MTNAPLRAGHAAPGGIGAGTVTALGGARPESASVLGRRCAVSASAR
jgi:hypothetical protein